MNPTDSAAVIYEILSKNYPPWYGRDEKLRSLVTALVAERDDALRGRELARLDTENERKHTERAEAERDELRDEEAETRATLDATKDSLFTVVARAERAEADAAKLRTAVEGLVEAVGREEVIGEATYNAWAFGKALLREALAVSRDGQETKP